MEQAQPYVGKIDYRKNLTPDLAIIQVQPADGRSVPDFEAGQFVALGLKLDYDYNITFRHIRYRHILKKRSILSFISSVQKSI